MAVTAEIQLQGIESFPRKLVWLEEGARQRHLAEIHDLRQPPTVAE